MKMKFTLLMYKVIIKFSNTYRELQIKMDEFQKMQGTSQKLSILSDLS